MVQSSVAMKREWVVGRRVRPAKAIVMVQIVNGDEGGLSW